MGFFGGGGSAASNMVGATSSAAGTAGLVPAPASGDQIKFLSGDASFKYLVPVLDPATFSNSNYNTLAFKLGGGGLTAGSLFSTRLYFCPILVQKDTTYNRLGMRYGSIAGCKCRIGLYNCSTTSLSPTTLVVDGGEVGNATNTNYEATINISLKKGFYFGCLIPAADTSMNCSGSYSDYMQCLMGTNQGASLGAIRDLFYYTTTYGAFSGDISAASFTAEAANIPLVYLRNV